MAKKVLIAVLALGIMLVSVPLVMAATNSNNTPEIARIQQQILDLKKQLVQKYVENGSITAEQGKQIQSNLDQHYKYQEQNGFKATPGGCAGNGSQNAGGMMGSGYGGMMGGYSATPQAYNNL